MRRTAITGIVLILGGASALGIRDEVPRWRTGGADAIRHTPLSAIGAFPVELAAGRPIIFIGDSNTAGTRIGGQARAYPALLQAPVRVGAPIHNQAIGGAIAPLAGQEHKVAAHAQLSVIMLGTNDAAPRRYLGRRDPVALNDFRFRLAAVVRSAMRPNASVLILAAPPVGSIAMNRRIAPYRLAAREVAVETGAHFLDPAAALDSDEPESAPFLLYDGLHVSADGQARLAKWLDQKFRLPQVVLTNAIHNRPEF